MPSAAKARSSAVLALLLLSTPAWAGTLKVPAQFETIQDAVDAAQPGDVVLVGKGTYRENVLVGTSGIALRGKQAVIDGRYLGDCITVVASGVEVSGFTLLNGGPSQLIAGPGDGSEAGGLRYVGTGALISKLTVRACDDYGIRLLGTGTVEKCVVDGCAGVGLDVETDDELGSVVTAVLKNTVRRCLDGIRLEDGPFTVEKNTCEQNLDDGLSVDIPPLFVEGLPSLLATTISRNTCRSNGSVGLDVFKGAGPALVVDKNVLTGNDVGLTANGFAIQVTGCTVDDNRSLGAFLLTTSGEFGKNKVRGNGFLAVLVASASIFADGGSEDGSNLLEDNTIQDNGGDGVLVTSSFNVLDGNLLKDNVGDGVQLDGGEIGNLVLDNTVIGNGHDGIDNSAGGTTISDNVCKKNGGADLAGAGKGTGSVDEASSGNVIGDDSGFLAGQELDLVWPIL